ncbi:MAG: type II CAAX endopeptidase family protein [Bacteroidota bacterium]
MLKKLFYTTFIEVEKERENYSSVNASIDVKTIGICVLTAFSLSMIYYIGHYDFLRNILLDAGATELLKKTDELIYSHKTNLGTLFYWVMMLLLFYLVLPALTIKFIFKEKISDYGIRWKGAFKDYHLYIIMLMVMIPLVVYFSGTKVFQSKYPFLNMQQEQSLTADFWKWELLYCTQFFALEFFFRGFILHGLKPRLGFYSVFVMTIPYCMIHFGKPMQETLAAIVAGIVLGCLSLKSRSILLGCLIHMSVGLGMDFAAMWQKGFFN